MANLKRFNKDILGSMTSMASQVVLEVDRAKISSYAMIVFLRCPQLAINIENFKMIVHIFGILDTNAFGTSDKQLLRAGTGLYTPSNFLINIKCKEYAKARNFVDFIVSNV